MATYFQTSSGSWCARIRSVKPHLSKTFPTKRLAEEWAKRVEGDIAACRAGVVPNKLTLGELVQRYKEEMQVVRPFGKNKLAVLGYFEDHLGDERVGKLSTQRIVRYIVEDRRITGVTAGIDLSYLGSMLRTAKTLWDIPLDLGVVTNARAVLSAQGNVSRSQERDRRPTLAEIEALRGWLDKHSRSLRSEHIDFIIDSCFRPPSEMQRLRWEDLNEKDKTIVIRDRKDPRKKYGNHQTVPLLGRSFEIVMRQPRSGDRIFSFNGRSWSSIFPRACRELGIKDLVLYDFRHEAISRLVESNKYSFPEMMLVTGHKDPKQLMRYTQLRAKDLHR